MRGINQFSGPPPEPANDNYVVDEALFRQKYVDLLERLPKAKKELGTLFKKQTVFSIQQDELREDQVSDQALKRMVAEYSGDYDYLRNKVQRFQAIVYELRRRKLV